MSETKDTDAALAAYQLGVEAVPSGGGYAALFAEKLSFSGIRVRAVCGYAAGP